MEKEEIHLNDIQRILFGQAPPEFLLEVFVRTLLIFMFCLAIVKWMGKRMNGQISVMEMTIMVIIGALISVPMQFPNRGLLQGFVLLLSLFVIYSIVNWIGFKYKKAEMLLYGKAIMLVKDNRLVIDEMRASHISRQQVFAELRNKDIFNLGEVKRLYLEACGLFSVYKEEKAKPGLLIFPPEDTVVVPPTSETVSSCQACCVCGFVKENEEPSRCNYCGCEEWRPAAKMKQSHE
jgi:uncharacterized membrane protein YcaP (DUF421 family)